jgi:hypothetical protein
VVRTVVSSDAERAKTKRGRTQGAFIARYGRTRGRCIAPVCSRSAPMFTAVDHH